MSLRRVKSIKRAAKPHTCSRCGATIAKGDSYVYWEMGFRPSYKRIRCSRTECYPRQSERETSNVSEAYAAQENAEDELRALDVPALGDWDTSTVEDVVQQAGDAITEVAQTYRDADEAFGGQGATEHAERADTLEAAADELGSWSASTSDPEPCDEHDELTEGCTECEEHWAQGWADLVDEALEAVTGVELP